MTRLQDARAAWRLLRRVADAQVVRGLAAALLVVSLAALLSGLAPLALKALVDAAQGVGPGQTPASATLVAAACYVAALAVSRLLGELRPLLAGTAEQRLSARLTRAGFAHMLGLPLQYHLQRRAGALVQTLDQAAAGCQILVMQVVASIVPVVVELITATVVLSQLGQPALVLAFVATALAYLGIHAAGAPRISERALAVAEASRSVHAGLTEGLSHPETVKGLGAEEAFGQRLAQATDALEHRWRSLNLLRMRLGLAVTVAFAVSLALLLTVAIDGLNDSRLSPGGFVLANVYLLQLLRPLESLGAASRDVAQALGFIAPLLDVLAEAPEPEDADRSGGRSGSAPRTPDPPAAPRLTVRNLHFAYGRRPALRGLDLDIAAGSMFAIVGPSGSGKSSLVRVLLRLCQPQQGSILQDGQPIDALPTRCWRSTIGVVFQDTVLFDGTLAANIAFGQPGLSHDEIEEVARDAGLQAFIASLPQGYETKLGERGLQLSGGERQRVAIARALARKPRILVLDEATSMLDTVTEARLLRGLQATASRRTTILVAHRLSCARHATQIAVLDGGRVVACGDHAGLLAQGGLYAQLWQAQVESGLTGAVEITERRQ